MNEAVVDVVERNMDAADDDRLRQQALLDSWLDRVSDLVQTVSLQDGCLLYTNRAWREALGYSRSEAQRLHLNDLLDPAESNPLEPLWCAFRDGLYSGSMTLELVLRARSGDRLAVTAHLDLWQAPAQPPVLRVIMQRRSWVCPVEPPIEPPIEPVLSPVALQPQELLDLKARFISLASHELRTPLAVIASSASILKDFGHQLDDTKRLKHLQCIQTYVKHTTKLLDDILLINQIATDRFRFQPTRCNLIEASRRLMDELQCLAMQHRMLFSVVVDSLPEDWTAGAEGCVDQQLLRQILSHLISNAAKYSPVGSPIRITMVLQPQWIHFEIADEGIGILPEDQPYICQLFHRGRNVGTIPGTGVGLCIVQSCVELHHGQLTLQSGAPQGAVFQVTLPRFSQEDSPNVASEL